MRTYLSLLLAAVFCISELGKQNCSTSHHLLIFAALNQSFMSCFRSCKPAIGFHALSLRVFKLSWHLRELYSKYYTSQLTSLIILLKLKLWGTRIASFLLVPLLKVMYDVLVSSCFLDLINYTRVLT